MIKIVAKMNVKKDKIEVFKETAKELVQNSAAEEGNAAYTLNVSNEDSSMFAIMEIWKDQAALDYHNNTKHFKEILPKLVEMTEGEMKVELYSEVEY